MIHHFLWLICMVECMWWGMVYTLVGFGGYVNLQIRPFFGHAQILAGVQELKGQNISGVHMPYSADWLLFKLPSFFNTKIRNKGSYSIIFSRKFTCDGNLFEEGCNNNSDSKFHTKRSCLIHRKAKDITEANHCV